MSETVIEQWWVVEDDEPKDGERARFAAAMDELVTEHADRPSFAAFLDWLAREALSQELYGEWLHAYTEALEPMFSAFDAGWFARKGEAVGYASGTA